jgi:hypothetical protein
MTGSLFLRFRRARKASGFFGEFKVARQRDAGRRDAD